MLLLLLLFCNLEAFAICAIGFQISKSQKKIFQKTILSLKLNFKLRIGFWNIFFFEILISEKRTALYSEKSHLYLFLINYVVNKRKSNNVVKSVYNGNLSHILQHLIQVKYQKNLSETFECTKNKIF